MRGLFSQSIRALLIACGLLTIGYAIWSQYVSIASASTEGPYDYRDIQLADQNGKAFSLSDFDDELVLVNFVFTGCATYCPVQTGALLTLYDDLRQKHPDKSFKFVSITLTPMFDRPRDMKAYAQRFSVVRDDWIFASGEDAKIKDILRQLNVEVYYGERPRLDVLHETDVFVLGPVSPTALRFEGIPLDHQGIANAFQQ